MKNERRNNLFTQVPVPKVSRNLFDLSHEVKMSGKFGYTYPVLCVETLPGDSFRNTMNCLLRFAPLLAPIMHRCDITTHFFFVPNRLLTDVWEDFITGGQDGTEEPVLPYVLFSTIQTQDIEFNLTGIGSLWDYLGLPYDQLQEAAPFSTEQISALPFRACGKVWNDYYRDPNFDEEMDLGTELSGNVSASAEVEGGYMDIRKYRRAYEKDYFTSALPFAQRGASVLIPMEIVVDRAVLTATGEEIGTPGVGSAGDITHGIMNIAGTGNYLETSVGGGTQINLEGDNATTTINDFRRALAIQRWLEANARGGARYTEQIQSHFNVQVPDYRLQRAEYLGGGKQPVQISEVLSTNGEGAASSSGVGRIAGKGISVGKTNSFTYRCQEHGFILGFLSITYRTAYLQGISKMWSRTSKYDYAWPELAHLGEQEILSKEVFFNRTAASDVANNEIFGYIPRYAEYKFHNDRVAGDFRTNLIIWHLARLFNERPTLDREFTTLLEEGIENDPEQYQGTSRRIFQVEDGTDYLWMQLYHHLTAKRPLPYFGVPRII